jgi:flagellar hook-basal body complex protein FliE
MAIEQLAGSIQTVPLVPSAGREQTPAVGGQGFGDSLARMVKAVETSNATANRAVTDMIDGQGDVHDAMIALQRADLTLQFTVQVRNKLVQAYQEIMRMPV